MHLDPALLDRLHAFQGEANSDAAALALLFELADSGCFACGRKLRGFLELVGVDVFVTDIAVSVNLDKRCKHARRKVKAAMQIEPSTRDAGAVMVVRTNRKAQDAERIGSRR